MRWWAAAALAMACRAASAPPVVTEPPRAKPVAQAPSPFPEVSPFRLPHTFEPQRYRLRIALGETRFTGHVEIEGELTDPVSLIWLHGVDLVVTRARAIGATGAVDLAFSAPRMDQLLGLRSEHELAPGQWTLAIDRPQTSWRSRPASPRFPSSRRSSSTTRSGWPGCSNSRASDGSCGITYATRRCWTGCVR